MPKSEDAWRFLCADYLPILLRGAKELGIVYINIIRGAKEPRNLPNHRGVMHRLG